MAQNVRTDRNALLLPQPSPSTGVHLWNNPASEALREAHGRHR